MEIIEERTIGPSLGAENIAKGFNSVTWGLSGHRGLHVCLLHTCSVCSPHRAGLNLLLLVAVLSMLQATLTLPGMAAMALALGMAIDSNVLINERVREELRNGASPQAAINAGYRPRLGHHPGLQRDHADRRPGLADLRLRPGARLCGGALHRHPDQHVLGGVLLARTGQLLVWPSEETQDGVDRHRVAAGRRCRLVANGPRKGA
jgi:hypothetical protein